MTRVLRQINWPLVSFLAFVALAIHVVGLRAERTRESVTKLQPQVTQIVKAAAACQPPVTGKRAATCAARIEAGLQECRENAGCRRAFAAVLVPPPEGGDATSSPPGHSQPGPPSSGPSHASEPPSSNPAPENSAPTSPAAESPAAEAAGPLTPVVEKVSPILEHVCTVTSGLAHFC